MTAWPSRAILDRVTTVARFLLRWVQQLKDCWTATRRGRHARAHVRTTVQDTLSNLHSCVVFDLELTSGAYITSRASNCFLCFWSFSISFFRPFGNLVQLLRAPRHRETWRPWIFPVATYRLEKFQFISFTLSSSGCRDRIGTWNAKKQKALWVEILRNRAVPTHQTFCFINSYQLVGSPNVRTSEAQGKEEF